MNNSQEAYWKLEKLRSQSIAKTNNSKIKDADWIFGRKKPKELSEKAMQKQLDLIDRLSWVVKQNRDFLIETNSPNMQDLFNKLKEKNK